MADMGWGGFIGDIAGISMAAVGQDAASKDRAQALKLNEKALQAWLDVHVPDPEAQKLVLQRYVSTGEYAPELEQAIAQGQSELSNSRIDPSLKQAQLSALQKLQQIGNEGGLTLAEQATQQKALADIESQNRGRQEAIGDKFAARGLGGSGLEIVQRQMAAQDATNRASQEQLSNLGSARERALQAIMQSGKLAGDIGEQDLSHQEKRAAAQDAINNFNTQNARSVAERNIAAQNKAQAYNLNNRQQMANANVDMANQEQQYNKELLQKKFQNNVAVAGGKTGQFNNLANAYNNSAQNTANQWGQYGQAAQKIGQGIDGLMISNNGSGQQSSDYEAEKKKLNDWKWG